jgi:hypothetical protein
VDPRAHLDDLEKILDPVRTQNSDPSTVQFIASCYTDYAILGLYNVKMIYCIMYRELALGKLTAVFLVCESDPFTTCICTALCNTVY